MKATILNLAYINICNHTNTTVCYNDFGRRFIMHSFASKEIQTYVQLMGVVTDLDYNTLCFYEYKNST